MGENAAQDNAADIPTQATNKVKGLFGLRFGSINIGSINKKEPELVNALLTLNIDIACVQETKLAGSSEMSIGEGFTFYYMGTTNKKNGVGIAVSQRLRSTVMNVCRVSDRLMSLKAKFGARKIRVVSCYAPQSGIKNKVKELEKFWTSFRNHANKTFEEDEYLLIMGDLNGHVGKYNYDYKRWHGGQAFGRRNEEGENILEFAKNYDLAVCNSFFEKQPYHLITYQSGGNSTQVDYCLVRRSDLRTVQDATVIPHCQVACQHRLLLVEIRWRKPIRKRVWRSAVLQSLLGIPIWWRTDKVLRAIACRRIATRKWRRSKTKTDHRRYMYSKEAVRQAEATAKAAAAAHLCVRLRRSNQKDNHHRLVNALHVHQLVVSSAVEINDSKGALIRSRRRILKRWKEHFAAIWDTENPQKTRELIAEVVGTSVPPITAIEVRTAMKNMKDRQARGCNSNLPADFEPIAKRFQDIVTSQNIPPRWTACIILPIWKGSGEKTECSSYRPIHLFCRDRELFEEIVSSRLLGVLRNDGLLDGELSGYTDDIHAVHILLEKYYKKSQTVFLAFLDLVKALENVPHSFIWYALRSHRVPEVYVKMIQLLYRRASSVVLCPAGISPRLITNVGIHNGSSLSHVLHVLCLKTLHNLCAPRNIGDLRVPWSLLKSGNVYLANDNKAQFLSHLSHWINRLEEIGIFTNTFTIHYMRFGSDEIPECLQRYDRKLVDELEQFSYFDSIISRDGSRSSALTAQKNSAFALWRQLAEIFQDKLIPVKVKADIYRSFVRPVLLHGAQCRPPDDKEREIDVLDFAEMHMLRWFLNGLWLHEATDHTLRHKMRLTSIETRMQQLRLQWFGRVKQADNQANQVIAYEPAGKNRVGRPRTDWSSVIKEDAKEVGVTLEQARDQKTWNSALKKLNPLFRK